MIDMKLASHNSWSYLKPRKWWMRLFRFMVRCQDEDISTQYEKYGVRCFDLRLKFEGYGVLRVNHNWTDFFISKEELLDDLEWLNSKRDVSVRVLLDVRTKHSYTETQTENFKNWCNYFEEKFPHIKFWGGRNLYNWNTEYSFSYEPTCAERYSSVCNPHLIDDWYPRWFARRYNKEIYQEGSSADFLMIDFVNYIK